MVQIANGSGSTLKENELSTRLLEAFFLAEKQPKEQTQNRITITTNFDANTASVSFSFNVVPIIDELGNIIHSTQNYLDDFGFNPGEGGDIKGDTLIQNIFEMLNLVSLMEKDAARNPQGLSRLTATYNYANSTFSGSMQFSLTTNLTSSGKLEIGATPYLV